MKIKFNYSILLVILTLSICSLLFTLIRIGTFLPDIEVVYDTETEQNKAIEKLEKENVEIIINDQKVFVGHDSLNLINWSYFNDPQYLYFYLSTNTCPPCILSTINLLKNYYDDFENNGKVIIISPDYPMRLRGNCYGKKLLVLEGKLIGFTVEQYDASFFFTLNKDLTVRALHVVNKMNFRRTENFIKQTLSEQN